MITKILLAGDGGQGVQTVADVICRSAFEKNLQVTHIPNYGLEQRGGMSLSYIKIGDEKIGYPKFSEADIAVFFSAQAQTRAQSHIGKNTIVLDFQDYQEEFNNLKTSVKNLNIFMLKKLLSVLTERNILFKDDIFTTLEKRFNQKSNWEEIKKVFN